MGQSTEKKQRHNRKLAFIAAYERWVEEKPFPLRFIAWHKWVKREPNYDDYV